MRPNIGRFLEAYQAANRVAYIAMNRLILRKGIGAGNPSCTNYTHSLLPANTYLKAQLEGLLPVFAGYAVGEGGA